MTKIITIGEILSLSIWPILHTLLEKTKLVGDTKAMKVMSFALLLISSAAFASPFGFKQNSLAINLEGSYLMSQKNFNDVGQLTTFSNQNSITEIKLDLNGSYDLSNSWGLYSKLSSKQFNSQSASYNYTATGISDLTLGTDFYMARFSNYNLIADFSLLIPFSDVPGADLTTFYSDGAYNIMGKVYLNFIIKKLKNYIYLGLNWRSLGLSTQAPFGLHSRYFFTPKFYTGVSIDADLTLANDQYTGSPSERYLVNQNYNASSLIYNSVNPQSASIKVTLGGLVFSNWSLSAATKYVFWGQRVADELRLFVSIGYQTASTTTKKFQADDEDKFQVDTQ
ncbi:MAG: hypothetical protein IPM57_07610 [Oligoflexia bacterium]|nr:hypothetical protein [Oligoflexia bacterium]